MSLADRITLATLRELKAAGHKFAMLTAYDYPTAVAAQAAGVHALLIGDSMGTVLLGHGSTRQTPLELMIILGEAVRRGAPRVYLVGDLPFETIDGGAGTALAGARRFVEDAGCDAVKIEAGCGDEPLVAAVARSGLETIVHMGLRPQLVRSPEGYRAQARDEESICTLVDCARRMVAAGAVLLLLEAVPPEASQAVVEAVSVPVIGCGAGPACDGHVLVTEDLLGLSGVRPPRFVPAHANLGEQKLAAMRRWVEDIASGAYPRPEHTYPMRHRAGAAR